MIIGGEANNSSPQARCSQSLVRHRACWRPWSLETRGEIMIALKMHVLGERTVLYSSRSLLEIAAFESALQRRNMRALQ
jgi:hypothetical protein